ncbi:MAG: hypothetical protein CMC15_18860 [Flavobacteriaceae bacterium]|nr:hypothetical protein [Flavobacteriaceae bacterium]|tara:strand:+ start:107 stop:337 length:231 start_codon:yes stop_codon:yes gene_type:complete
MTGDKLWVSTLDVDGYDLIVVSKTKIKNEIALINKAAQYHQNRYPVTEHDLEWAKNRYADAIRHEQVKEFGEVIFP